MSGSIEGFGREFTRGALLEVGKWVALLTVACLLGSPISYLFGYGWDNTDNRSAGLHSNMRLRTDYGTGCQYLESQDGALTPRLDHAGKQVCR